MRRLWMAAALIAAWLASPALGEERSAPDPVTALAPGMVGAYFPPPPGRHDVILVLGGSEGGLGGSQPLAKVLSQHGFGALALAYFNAPGLPDALKEIPLENIEAAVDWLQNRPEVGKRPVAVMGGSKGAELALLLASRDPRFCAVVGGMPSSVVWAGIDLKNLMTPVTTSSWSAGGKPAPFVAYQPGPFRGVRDLYERSLPKAPLEATIPAEKVNGPILLVSGGRDQLSPSTPMGEAVMARLNASGFRWPHQHLIYGDAGHAGFGPPVPVERLNLNQMGGLGGTPEAAAAARADGWPKVLAFLDQAFAGKSCRGK